MSKNWIVVSTARPPPDEDVDFSQAEIIMRFSEEGAARKMAQAQAGQFRSQRFYVLSGASSWYESSEDRGG